MRARRLTLVWLTSLCVLPGAMLLCSSSAFAARGHVFGGTFGEPCSGAPCGKGQFKEPGQVAVNEASGDVYVIDRGDDRVEWFTSYGQYLGQFDGSGSFEVGGKIETGTAAGGGGQSGEIATGKFTRANSIAIDNACALHSPMLTETTTPTCHEFDPSAGDVYLLDAGGHEVIDKFSATGEYVGQLTASKTERFEQLVGVSVDSTGLVWVDRNRGEGLIYSFSDANPNSFVSERIVTGGSVSPEYEGSPSSFSVDYKKSFDYFYLGTPFGSFAARYTSLGEGIELINGKSSLESNFTPLVEFAIGEKGPVQNQPVYALALNQTTHEPYTSSQENFVTRFSEKLSLVEQFGAGHVNSGGGRGIAVDSPSEEVYVADSLADVVDMFPSEPPGV